MTEQRGVTVVGLGLMGTALARAFLAAGHETTVWNRTSGKADALVAEGARRAATLADAFAAEVVVVCVTDYAATRELLAAGGVARPGGVLVNLTSGTPAEARELAAWAAGAGVDYLDGAALAIPAFIGQPQTRLFYGGSQTALDAAKPALDALGSTIHLGADAGLAALYDLALLGAMWSMVLGWLHAAALVGSEGVTAEAFTPLASDWLGEMIGFLPAFAQQVDAREYATDVSTLTTNAAGAEHLLHASRAQGVGVDVHAPLLQLLERAIADGRGDDSFAGLVELMRPPAAS